MTEWRIKPGKLEEFKKKFEDIGLGQLTPLEDRTKIPRSTLDRIWKSQGWRTDMAQLDALMAPLVSSGKVPLTPDKKQQIEELKRDYSDIRKAQPRNRGRNKPTANEPPVTYMVDYIKLIHLRDQITNQNNPIYRRIIPHPNKKDEVIDVYDEMLVLKSMAYRTATSTLLIGRRKEAYITLQPTFPPRTEIVPHHFGEKSPGSLVDHIEATPSNFNQAAFLAFNSFQIHQPQPGEEKRDYHHVGTHIDEDCGRYILVLDLTSLPVRQEDFLKEPPVAWHFRASEQGTEQLTSKDKQLKLGHDQLKISYAQSYLGMYILDTAKQPSTLDAPGMWNPSKHTLRKNDTIELRFVINWDDV